MRVLYLTINPNLGSSTRTLQHWILLGRERGLWAYACLRERGPLADWLDCHQVPWRTDPMQSPDRKRPLRSMWGVGMLAWWCRRQGIQVIHAEHDVYPFASWLGRMLRCPVICHCHFGISREFCAWAFAGKRMPAALIWTSEQQRSDCAHSTPGIVPDERQHVIPLGLDGTTFGRDTIARESFRSKLGIQAHELVLGTASAIQPRKRSLDFVEVVKKVASRHSHVVGLMAGDARPGDEAYKAEVLHRLEEAGLGRRFRWLGKLVAIEPFFQGIDLYVSASEYETFGMSVCEAMTCGRPVVAYRGGSVHEVVGDAGIVAETGDLVGLREGVERLVVDPVLREELGKRARQRVMDVFDCRQSLELLLQIYEFVLGRKTTAKRGELTEAAPSCGNGYLR